jgi:hypothetical protein
VRRITATAAALLAALTCLVVRAAQAQAATVTYPAVIHGVNLDGTESACKGLPWNDYQGKTFDGPTDSGSVTALQSWHINMVRVPINEDCWLGINGLPASPLTYTQYRYQLKAYVKKLTGAGIYVEIDLHQTAPGTRKSTTDDVMADASHGPTIWKQMANVWKGHRRVSFDLFNEPAIGGGAQLTSTDWHLWLEGGYYSDPTWGGADVKLAGMNQLITAIRNTGATNTVIVAGLDWAQDFDKWASYTPTDPAHNLIAAIHMYPETNNPTPCWEHGLSDNSTCWADQITPLGSTKFLVEEFGEDDCDSATVDTIMPWMDAHGLGGNAWTWDTQGGPSSCPTGWSLISDFETGAPTTYGQGVHRYYTKHPVDRAGGSGLRSDRHGGVRVGVTGRAGRRHETATAARVEWTFKRRRML